MKKENCFWTLYKFELRKITRNIVAIVTFLVLLFTGLVQANFEVTGGYEGTEHLDTNMNSVINDRQIDDELMAELMDKTDEAGNIEDPEDEGYEGLSEWVQDVMGYGRVFDDIDGDMIYEERTASIEEAHDEMGLTQEERDYWKEQEDKITKPFAYRSDNISAAIFEGISNHMLMLIMLTAASLSSVFAMETQRKTDPMIRSTINGTKELYFAKMAAGMSYILMSLTALLASFFAVVGIRFGFRGMDAAIQLSRPFAACALNMWQVAGILLVILLTGAVLTAAFALLISNITRNAVASMALVIAAYLGLYFGAMSVPLKFRFLSQALNLLPGALVSSRMVYEYRLIHLGGYFTCYQAAPVIYIVLTALLVTLGYVFYKKHEIKAN